jgi:glycosyltransferase involved in cell wall biosynthesis
MSQKDLWVAYAVSDVFLLTSKAEGLGMPLMEAMAVGIPCVATDCTGMAELLNDGRGYLLQHRFIHRDPFGNGRRYWVDIGAGVYALEMVYQNESTDDPAPRIETARKYVEERTWDIAVDQVEKALLDAIGEENDK